MSIFQASAVTSCPILRRRPHKPSCSRHSAAAFAFHIPPRLRSASARLIIHCSRSVDQLTQADPPPPPLLHTTFEGTKERIRKLFHHKEVELSVSSYDTAWVALLPSTSSNTSSDPPTPCFPQCLHWLLENQLPDGSWGPPLRHPLLLKDALSSTLASIIALKRWGVGQHQIDRGLHFLELNFASATDKDQHSPFGFDIIFAGLLEYATNLNLALPIEPTDLNVVLRMREFELKRCYESHSRERELYFAYVSEGLGSSQNWEMVMKHQMKNGSIFNSPSTTAAALMHHHNAGCLDYLSSLLEKFGNAVPTVYPLDLYAHLCMVDNLERLGIGRHFRMEIRSILDETYRCWLQEDEQIFTDVATCAMAFRLLRMNGYDVSSDTLSDIANKKDYVTSLGGHFKDLSAALEVYRASEMIIYHDELTLGELNSRSSHFLKQKLSDTSFPSDGLTKHIIQEVDEALKFPFNAVLERMASRSYIEHYNVESTRILKTSFCFSNISNKDFLKLALEDYNACQSIYQEELEYLERWVVENSLDKLKFARQKAAYCYFSAAATLYSPELSDARMSWAKNGVLTTVVDDFFDIGGSMEELLNLIQLVEKWDVNIDEDCCSEPVRIIFLALQRSICEIGEHALKWQARSVTGHVIEIWLDLMNSMLREAVWVKDGCVPKLDEYMENGCVSFALGPIILPALYLVGPKLGEDVVRSSEYEKLFKLVSSIGRLWNDIQSFKREFEEGKLNAVGLGMITGTGNEVAEEEAVVVQKMKNTIECNRRELLGLVLQEKGSVVARECKDLFWNMNQIVNLFYANDDGFTSHAMINIVNSILHNPISLPPSLPEL